MKVLICGAGRVGSAATRVLAGFPEVSALVLGDIDGDRATAVATAVVEERRGRAQVATSQLDIHDPVQLRAAVQACSVVVNCAGPAAATGTNVLEACIERGAHYVDVCDDPESTSAMLAKHADAVSAGITAVVGMGLSPGMTNLLAVIGSRHLELVNDLFIGSPLDVPGPGQHSTALDEMRATSRARPSASAIHAIDRITGRIDVVERGRVASRRPMLPVELDYPNIGNGTAWIVGHPEPLTLFERIPISRTGLSVTLTRRSTAALLHRLSDAVTMGSMSPTDAARRLVGTPATTRLRSFSRSRRYRSAGGLPPVFALLRGELRTHPKQVGAHLTTMPAGLGAASAVPAALVARRILDGSISTPGVFPPESAVDPERFFADLHPYCDPPVRPGEYLVLIEEAMGKAPKL